MLRSGTKYGIASRDLAMRGRACNDSVSVCRQRADCLVKIVFFGACLSGLIACNPAPAATSTAAATGASLSVPTGTEAKTVPAAVPTNEATAAVSATPRPTPAPDAWKSYPAVPEFGRHAKEIFDSGAGLGRDGHVFSKIGDCQNITTYFLADFESPEKFRLGPYGDLQSTIDWFAGSFGRKSLAVKGGLNVASVMNPLMANRDFCDATETPLACEIRVNNPSLVLISFEEAWDGNVEKYETYLRKVIEYAIGQGVVPVVATKADNLEGGDRINTLIARLAWEYDIPLWNFWVSVQNLRSHGLTEDGFHLTQTIDYHNFYFDLKPAKWSGWMARNLTALQVLDAARREVIAPAAS